MQTDSDYMNFLTRDQKKALVKIAKMISHEVIYCEIGFRFQRDTQYSAPSL
jgi:hypothetical protein